MKLKLRHEIFIRWAGISGLLLGWAVPTLSGAEPKKPAPPASIGKLGWLAGAWRLEKGGRVIDEHWMPPAAGVMLGMARTVAKGKVVEHEFLQIREGPGGELFYVTQPSGQKEATYQIASLTGTDAVFANPQREFPPQISYALHPDGTLLVTLEGPGPDGQVKKTEFSFHRVNQ